MGSHSPLRVICTLSLIIVLAFGRHLSDNNSNAELPQGEELVSVNETLTNGTTYSNEFPILRFIHTDKATNGSHPTLKKAAYYVQINSSQIQTVRDLVRAVINSRAAPVIKNIFWNLDRDLFKLFTPSGPPPPLPSGDYSVVFQHEYPSEKPATIPTTTEGSSRSNHSTISPPIMKYALKVKTTTTTTTTTTTEKPRPVVSEEDDEDESDIVYNINNNYKLE